MCGIAGLYDPARRMGADIEENARAMADALRSRGPDACGVWSDPQAGIALGHRRLSIVDLSTTGGGQPMVSADGRFVLSYNGEIYNAPAIARELPDVVFRGHSDTEVLLEGCARWGVEATLARTAGMFAFALWDRRDQTLVLARDRIGIKPLYYAPIGAGVIFASELKAMSALAAFRPRVDPTVVAGFLRHGCVVGDRAIYDGVLRLAPGHLVRIDREGRTTASRWWSLREAVAVNAPFRGDAEEAGQRLESLLTDVVREHMLSDVPLGAFLSGGIDSSLVVATMQANSSRPVRTFSIGFREGRFNEADHAREVARHLKTDHTELVVEPADALAVIPLLPTIYDEPFADSSQIPTFLVSRLARRSVTVALSGDGGDEGFAGYTRYHGLKRLWGVAKYVPSSVRSALADGAQLLSSDMWDRIGAAIPAGRRPAFFGDKVHKAANVFAEPTVEAMYRRLVAQWETPAALVGASEPGGPWDDPRLPAEVPDIVARMRHLDMSCYLPDDILTKVDRASMAASLEARVPLLDHRVVEFAFGLPTDLLMRGGRGKLPLRRLLAKAVPDALIERPKMGFGVPIGEWMRGPLRDYVEDMLGERSLAETGLVAVAPVRQRLAEHMSGRRNWQYALWTVLMLQAWARHWRVRA